MAPLLNQKHVQPRASAETIDLQDSINRCGIILAAGEGKRVQPFVRRLRGDDLPKQYVNFIGTRSMLEHTFHRAETLIPAERIFTVVSRSHLSHPEVRWQLAGRPHGTLVIQPENKETGPGLLLPLMYVIKHFPDSTVVVFPSDHFILQEKLFMDHVELACHAVEKNFSWMVLLGVQPSEPEPAYGYILPGTKKHSNLHEIWRFIEKPEPEVALNLLRDGGLWNTMVMIFKAGTMVDLVCRAVPRLYRVFAKILDAIGTPHELKTINDAYRQIEAMNFSKGLLENFSVEKPSRLMVLPVLNVYWSDWGSEQRIMSDLKKSGFEEPRRATKEKLSRKLAERNRIMPSIR